MADGLRHCRVRSPCRRAHRCAGADTDRNPAPPAEPAAPYSDLRYLPWLDEYAQQTYQPGEYTAEDLYTYTYNTGTVFAGPRTNRRTSGGR